jgi:hypothetical protein
MPLLDIDRETSGEKRNISVVVLPLFFKRTVLYSTVEYNTVTVGVPTEKQDKRCTERAVAPCNYVSV